MSVGTGKERSSDRRGFKERTGVKCQRWGLAHRKVIAKVINNLKRRYRSLTRRKGVRKEKAFQIRRKIGSRNE